MTIAHVAAVPLEELLAFLPVAGATWVALRSRLHRVNEGSRAESGPLS